MTKPEALIELAEREEAIAKQLFDMGGRGDAPPQWEDAGDQALARAIALRALAQGRGD